MTLSKDEKQQKLAEARKKIAQRIQDIDTLHQQSSANVNNVIATTQAATNDLAQVTIKHKVLNWQVISKIKKQIQGKEQGGNYTTTLSPSKISSSNLPNSKIRII